MAKASRLPEIGNPDTRDVRLDLSYDEASFLRNVCRKIGGSSAFSPRRHSDDIGRALDFAGIRVSDADRFTHLARGGLSYEDGQPKSA